MSKKSKVVDIQEAVFFNLPCEILTNILSRLPVRSIISCKYVCKQFLQIISTPEFAKSHLSVSTPPGLVIYQSQRENLFKLLEYEDTLKLQNHNLRNLELMKLEPSNFTPTFGFELGTGIWGSVNGFLCLGHYTHMASVYICNPITRELIHLPMPKQAPKATYFDRSGFGFSKSSGQYKVVVNYNANIVNKCFVYTLGTTGSWRSVAPDPKIVVDIQPTGQFMNGNLHWLVSEDYDVVFISCFDLESEQFKYFSPPQNWVVLLDQVCFGILEDRLCLCADDTDNDNMVLWVMTEYGIERSWTRKFEIGKRLLEDWSSSYYGAIFPVKAFADGGILFSWENELLFYYCDKTKSTRSVKVFEDNSRGCRGGIGNIEVLTHTFSFISLKRFGVENVISF